jgi:enoyl-CoA hydratase
LPDRYHNLALFDVTVEHGIAHAVLADEAGRNMYDTRTHRDLAELAELVATDPEVRVLLLSAAGPIFSGGGTMEHVAELAADESLRRNSHSEARRQVRGLVELDKPVVVALSGAAHGGVLTLVLLADIIVAEEQVRIRDAHVRLGLPAGDGGSLTWTAAMGPLKAKRYLLTGDALTAAEAERLGLVTEVVPTGHSYQRALEYARRLADGPAQAIQATKRSVNQWLRQALPGFELSLALEMDLIPSEQSRAAVHDLLAGGPGAMPGF